MPSTNGKTAPLYAPASELSVLRRLVECMDEAVHAELFDLLEGTDFGDERNAVIFNAAASLREDRAPIEYEALIERLRRDEALSLAGGAQHIGELLDVTPAFNYEYHANLIRAYSLRRKLREALTKGVALVEDAKTDLDEVAHEVERMILSATDRRADTDSLRDLGTYLAEFVGAVEKSEKGLSWGLPDLDELTRGLRRERLYMILARPSVGKSALLNGVALNAAIHEGAKVAFFSVENGEEEWLESAFAWVGDFDMHTFRSILASDRPDLAQGAAEFAVAAQALSGARTRLHLDTKSRTTAQMMRRARRMKARHGLDLAVVDHIHEMDGDGDTEDQRRARITRDLKRMAKELGIPVLAAGQLNRECESRPDKRPVLSDARASGGIEEASDTIGLLYRPEYYFGPTMKVGSGKDARQVDVRGYAEWIIGKNRGASRRWRDKDNVPLYFRAQSARFEAYSNRREW